MIQAASGIGFRSRFVLRSIGERYTARIRPPSHLLPGGCDLYDTIDDVPLELWDEARAATPSCFTDPAFLRAVESGAPAGARVWHAIIPGEDGRPAACASLCFLPVDLLMLASPRLLRASAWPRHIFPGLGRLNLLLCGLPVSAGQSQLGFTHGADRARAVDRLDLLLRAVARREGASAIVYKEFGEADRDYMDRLQAGGYIRADSPPLYQLTHAFPHFPAYRAALTAHYRRVVRISERKFERVGCRTINLVDPEQIARVYTSKVHRLYEAVVEKSEVKLELLPVEFFHALVRRLPGKATLTLVYEGEAIVAFLWGLSGESAYHFLFCGIDYTRNADADLYFNLMYREFDRAFRTGAKVVELGQTADAFKTRLGCSGEPRYFYARGSKALLSWFIRRAAGSLFPPRQRFPEHHVFKAATKRGGRMGGSPDTAVKPGCWFA